MERIDRREEGKAETITITITVTNCKECPYAGKTITEVICNNPKRVHRKPYAKDRKVNPEGIDNGCPIR